MTSKARGAIRVHWLAGLFIAATVAAPGLHASDSLRLVATTQDAEFDRFVVYEGSICPLELGNDPPQPLTGRVRWRLEGNLRRNAHLLHFAPRYYIGPDRSERRSAGQPPTTIATTTSPAWAERVVHSVQRLHFQPAMRDGWPVRVHIVQKFVEQVKLD